MPMESVVELGRKTLEAALYTALPILAIAIVVSLVINIVQVLTSVQDSTVATVLRLLATAVAVFLMMPWLLRRLGMFTSSLFSDFNSLVR